MLKSGGRTKNTTRSHNIAGIPVTRKRVVSRPGLFNALIFPRTTLEPLWQNVLPHSFLEVSVKLGSCPFCLSETPQTVEPGLSSCQVLNQPFSTLIRAETLSALSERLDFQKRSAQQNVKILAL